MTPRRPKWTRVRVREAGRTWSDYYLGDPGVAVVRVREQVEHCAEDGTWMHGWELERLSLDHRPRWLWCATWVLLADAKAAGLRVDAAMLVRAPELEPLPEVLS